jgi:hypothetical protein
MGGHVLDVRIQEVFAEIRVFRMPWDRLDEAFLVGGGVECLKRESWV